MLDAPQFSIATPQKNSLRRCRGRERSAGEEQWHAKDLGLPADLDGGNDQSHGTYRSGGNASDPRYVKGGRSKPRRERGTDARQHS